MKHQHRLFAIFILLLSCVSLQAQTPAQQSPGEENVSFQWAFGAMVGDAGAKKFVSVTKDTTLHSGDQVKMLVQLTKDCYVYVVHVGSKGEVSLLFPYDIKQISTDYKTGRNYYIPKGRGWDVLDNNTGRETFYVLASTDRLLDLEAKLGNYFSADASKQTDLGKDVVTEIRNVKKHYKNFATLAEKPITIGGNVRGLEKAEEARRPDVSTIATQVSANNFYSKTFTVDHQ